MAFGFNPFTGNFDLTGGGDAAPFAGQVDAYADLPLDTTAALNSRWLVKNNSGTWPFSTYKQAGIYIRVNTLNASRDTDYQFVGTLPSVMNDSEFLVYDDTDATKNLKFNVGTNVPTSSTVTLTVPASSGTIARTETFAAPPAIGNTTAAAGSFTTLSASDALTASNATASPPTTLTATKGVQWLLPANGYAAIAGIYPGSPAISLLTGSVGGMTELSRFSSSGITFNRALTANNGTLTASAPVLDLAQTWNASGVTFTGLRLNVTDTASALASNLAEFQVGGTGVAQIRKDGSYRIVGGGDRTIISTGGLSLSAAAGGSWLQVSSTVATNGSYRSFGNLVLLSNVAGGTDPVVLDRDGLGVFAQRSGSTPQRYNLYGQFTTTTNFERLFLEYNSTATAFRIGTEKGSGGGTARALEFQTDGVTRMTIGATGLVTVTANASNALTISGSNPVGFNGVFLQNTSNGSSSSTGFTAQNNSTAALVTRVYSSGVTGVSVFGTALANFAGVFADGAAVAGLMAGTGNSTPIIFGTNNIERVRITSGGEVTFGGTTSSFPALKRSSTTLQVRLADDTAFAPLACGALTLNGNLDASTRDIVTDITTGTKIGTATTQKIGFFNATPVVQQAAVADATDAASTQARLNDLLARLRTLGLIAT